MDIMVVVMPSVLNRTRKPTKSQAVTDPLFAGEKLSLIISKNMDIYVLDPFRNLNKDSLVS